MPAALNPAGGRAAPETIEIAVATHCLAGSSGCTTDLDNLVSAPIRLRLPAAAPSAAAYAAPPACTPGSDPFVDRYPELPKILDNRKVVQVKLDLADSRFWFTAQSLTAGSEWEVSRTTEDAVRSTMLHDRRRPRCPSPEPPNCPAPDPSPADFAKLSADDQHCHIVTRLTNDWTDPNYSLQSAFQPVGRVHLSGTPVKGDFLDEIDGSGAAFIYYAVKPIRFGGPRPAAALLKLCVKVPDVRPPAGPAVSVARHGDGRAVLEWTTDASILAYDVHVLRNGVEPPRRATRVARLFQRAADAMTGTFVLARRPLAMRPRQVRLVARAAGAGVADIDLRFSLAGLGIATAGRIRALYRRADLPPSRELLQTDFARDPKNLWSYVTVSTDTRRLLGVPLTDGEHVAVVFIDGAGRYRTMDTIDFHHLPSSEAPNVDLSSVRAVIPLMRPVAVGHRVCLFLDSASHAISSAAKVRGVYRLVGTASDPGFGKPGAINHWITDERTGAPNTEAGLSPSHRVLHGVHLPHGTTVVIESEKADGSLQNLTHILPGDHPLITALPAQFMGLLPSRLTDPPAGDAGSLYRELSADGLAVIGIGLRFDDELREVISGPVDVRLGLGSASPTLDAGTSVARYEYLDPSGTPEPTFRVTAVRRVQLGAAHVDVESVSR